MLIADRTIETSTMFEDSKHFLGKILGIMIFVFVER